VNIAQVLFISAASLMFLEAVGYSFGALRRIHQACAPSDPYWSRRLLLNLMLANAGLYFTSLSTLARAYVGGTSSHRRAGQRGRIFEMESRRLPRRVAHLL